MTAVEIHKGDIGTIFRVLVVDENDAALNISSATKTEIIFRKPSGTHVHQDAEFLSDGTDGYLIYTTELDDLDEVGEWEIQAYVEMGAGKWHTQIQTFPVEGNLG